MESLIFNIDGFKEAVRKGLFLPDSLSYGFVDEEKFEKCQKQQEWKTNKISDVFDELRQRMGHHYFKNVVFAQTCALDYAALQFPAYSMLIDEDLTEDWLAIIDFHRKHCRDHSLHQSLTAYVAASLLGNGESNKAFTIPVAPGNLLDYCVNAILKSEKTLYIRESAFRHGIPQNMLEDNAAAREFWKGLFYRTVVLSALFHDIGYPWQYTDRIGSSLKSKVEILHPLDTTVDDIVACFKDRMVLMPLQYYANKKGVAPMYEKKEFQRLIQEALKTHGFPGAIAFLALNDAIRKYPSEQPNAMLQEFCVEWAAMGIFMHDMAGKQEKNFPKLRVCIEKDPLSAIISISDYLEEFSRPKVKILPKFKESRMKYYHDCTQVSVEMGEEGTLTVKMKYTNASNKAIANEFKRKETYSYFDPGNGYVDLSPIGVRKVVFELE